MQTDLKSTQLLHHRIKVLDGFRGLAILLVMGYHYFSFFSAGWVGVDLFFVLSGFLITGKLVAAAGKPHYFSAFYWRRLLRVVPLYYGILLLFFIAVPLLWPSSITASYRQLLHQQGYYWMFFINFYNALHGWTENIIFVPLWSIACEMQFYLIWPLLVVLLRNKRQWTMPVLTALILFGLGFRLWGGAIFSMNTAYRYVLLPSRIDAFSTGALLYFFVSEKKYTKWLSTGWLSALLCLAAAVYIMWHSGEQWALGAGAVASYGYTLNALFWASIIGLALGGKGMVSSFFQIRWLQATGKYSYGMYLLHVPVKVLMAGWCKHHFPSINMNYLALLFVVVTVILSFISYHLLEKRLLKYKDVFN